MKTALDEMTEIFQLMEASYESHSISPSLRKLGFLLYMDEIYSRSAGVDGKLVSIPKP